MNAFLVSNNFNIAFLQDPETATIVRKLERKKAAAIEGVSLVIVNRGFLD